MTLKNFKCKAHFFYLITSAQFISDDYLTVQMNIQKQPPEEFYVKRCFKKFHKIRRKTPVQESFLKRDSGTGVFL